MRRKKNTPITAKQNARKVFKNLQAAADVHKEEARLHHEIAETKHELEMVESKLKSIARKARRKRG